MLRKLRRKQLLSPVYSFFMLDSCKLNFKKTIQYAHCSTVIDPITIAVKKITANTFAKETKQAFTPYIEETGKIITSCLNNKYSDDVRGAAGEALRS